MDSSANTLSKMYQKLTDREHILERPDTYIGSVKKDKIKTWAFKKDIDDETLVLENKEFVPGFYKCFDEGLVNALDHSTRMNEKIRVSADTDNHYPVSFIHVAIDNDGIITIHNDGDGIDVAQHPEHKLWIPEMIFGHLRTSTNYQNDQIKIVGGKNGFGFKLVLIYSDWGKIETVDHTRGLKYVQEFGQNLTVIKKPKITKCKSKPYTKVTWKPDYKRFGLDGLTPDLLSVLKKRVYDISAIGGKTLKVKYNGTLVPIKTFEQYVNMFVGNKSETKRVFESANKRWEYAVCLSPIDEFTSVSFVNGIYTSKGGKHVDYVLNQITKKVVDLIEKKKKVKVKASSIKEQIMLFVNCVVNDPSFDSQTKDTLTTSQATFGSTCKVSDKFVENVAKLGIVDQAISIHNVKTNKESKKTDGKKTRTIIGIPKLVDANHAGTKNSHKCVLILCEGDSAKAGIVSGLSKDDRNIFGVYPLKGKLMNIRDAVKSKINDNKEIADIKKIMGLESNKDYNDSEDIKKNLRYGQIVILTDQDLDGVHIKGLCINMFQCQWKNLIKEPSFLGYMNTPIIKAKKGKHEICFYNEQEYMVWKEKTVQTGWSTKYYKGLGTSTSTEFKEYFKNRKLIQFEYNENSDDALDKVFRKSRSEDRKDWLMNYDKKKTISANLKTLPHSTFIDDEFIHFSKYDCERSIPNMMDGLKISQRKILFCAFKRHLTKEIKVAQFGGYVSEHSGYHHGENSLMQAIVGMAQDFVGSNNINLLLPNGQFGTRIQGGSDSASERYIFTQLSLKTRKLFREDDDFVLTPLYDDGKPVEPEFYTPIIPMVLINGAIGIGTGFSTYIPSYNPKDIVQYIQNHLNDIETLPLIPWYNGFKGTVESLADDDKTFIIKGSHTVFKDVVHVTELPIGMWIDTFKALIEKYISANKYIKEYTDNSTDKVIDFKITFIKGELEPLIGKNVEHGCNGLEKILQLYCLKRTTNMHLFDENQQLKKFNTVEEIIQKFIPVRIDFYEKRKAYKLNQLEKECLLLKNKSRFIQEQYNDVIDLRRKKKLEIISILTEGGYDVVEDDTEFKYLRNMTLDSLLLENSTALDNQYKTKHDEIESLKNKTVKDIWLEELSLLGF